MSVLEKFKDVVDHRHQYAQEWKARSGGKVFGYLCTYVPEEILHAGGILPVRILGSHEPQDITEAHIFDTYCAHCRDCLAEGLKGRYHYLDGLVHAQSCRAIYQTFDSWGRNIPVPYSHHIFFPGHIQSPHAEAFSVGELSVFKHSLEEWLRESIPDAALDKSIEVFNNNRRLMKQLYELRKSDSPAVTGAEAMEVVLASMLMDKEEHSHLLTEALKELSKRKEEDRPRARLMVVGSENDNPDMLRLIESMGAVVVIDDLCTGSRYFWNEVVPNSDVVRAIAARYISRPACPLKDLVERRRLPHLLRLAKEYRVDGVILIHQTFCDPHELDNPAIRSMFEENDIPTLTLEWDLVIPVGQFQTRIQAFLETLEV